MCDRFPVKINPAILYRNIKVCNFFVTFVTRHMSLAQFPQTTIISFIEIARLRLMVGLGVQPPFYCDYIIFIVSGF